MSILSTADKHKVLNDILSKRGLDRIDPRSPFWKLKLDDKEYENLKQVILTNQHSLYQYGTEAALCYAEWWRRDYNGNIPSKEEVARGIGLNIRYKGDLYVAARDALKRQGVSFIHSQKGTEYFRTLLNLGGLPMKYINNNDGNFGSFTRFLKGIIKELSTINVDWNSIDSATVKLFDCVAYLGKAFKNEHIYDLSIQIARAIINDDHTYLPYDENDKTLKTLTNTLTKEYGKSKNVKRRSRFSLQWRLHMDSESKGSLYVMFNAPKDISSETIPGLDIENCYSFDVFIEGSIVAKYIRKTIVRSEERIAQSAIYTAIHTGTNRELSWRGDPLVEVKLRCDNDDRIFMTVAGGYSPNFDYPLVFQEIEDNVFALSKREDSEENIAVYSSEWRNERSKFIEISGRTLYYEPFSQKLELCNRTKDEKCMLKGKSFPYSVEIFGNYLSWIEHSNFKLIDDLPKIRVYDKEQSRIKDYKVSFRARNGKEEGWKQLKSSTVLPFGVIDIRILLPDGYQFFESFYNIGDLSFHHKNAKILSTEICFDCSQTLKIELEHLENITTEPISYNCWRFSRNCMASICPSECVFHIYKSGEPMLKLGLAIPFEGIMVTDLQGKLAESNEMISYGDLSNYHIKALGSKNKKIYISYTSNKLNDNNRIKSFKANIINGLVSLDDYRPLIDRMFAMYGTDSFNRSSHVIINIDGKQLQIRKFILESTIEAGKIIVSDNTEDRFIYEGDLFAFPVGMDIHPNQMYAVRLNRENPEANVFSFPEDFPFAEVLVFSGTYDNKRIVPKYYHREYIDLEKGRRDSLKAHNISLWQRMLKKGNVMSDSYWQRACKAFELCSTFNLPFSTHKALTTISQDPYLLANFIIAILLNGMGEIFVENINRYEQELEVAIHWIPREIWSKCMDDLMLGTPQPLIPMILIKSKEFVSLLQNVISVTTDPEVANVYTTYVVSNNIDKCQAISRADVNRYKSKIKGVSDTNLDLPIVRFNLTGTFYPKKDSMPVAYRVMMEAAMCAAENSAGIRNRTDLFSIDKRQHARVVNYYRNYCKEAYCEIFIRTLKYLNNNQ